jgi:CDP-diacylglycerol--glycerol-3-phosphate 3-phosphatidyltransferase
MRPRITANQVTFARLILMPLLCLMLYGGETAKLWAVILGTLIGCTDFVDGYLARKHGPTVLGGLMDPIADKVFIAVGYLPFADEGWVPWWLVMALFVREFLVTALRSSFELRQTVLKSSYLAKVKTWVQMIGLGLVMLLLVVHSRIAILSVFGFFTVAPLLGAIIFGRKTGKSWTGAWVGAFGFALCVGLYLVGGGRWLTIGLFIAMVGITWVTGLDYMVLFVRQLRDVRAFDVSRIVGAIALPVVATLALVTTNAPPWAVIAIVSLELGHGGLDNLLAHHGAAASAWAWGGRILGATALLGLAMALPAYAVALTLAAFAVSLAGTAAAFLLNRRYYLEEKLREKKRTLAPGTPAVS